MSDALSSNPRAVAAIVLHWGDAGTTERCLDSLLAEAPPRLSVIVVDGASAIDWEARRGATAVSVLRPGRNEGYAGGNNLALRVALTRGDHYALLLNNDAVLGAGALDHMLADAERDPRIAFVGARVVRGDDPSRDEGSYGRVTYGPYLVQTEGETAGGSGPREVEWVSGCCVLARLSAVREIGLLDEAFFLYGEDVDWCLRARRAGYRVVHEPRAVALHFSAATPAATCRRAYFLARNGILLARKHGRPSERLKTVGLDLVLPLASLIRRALRREPLAAAGWVARGVLDGLLGRPPRLAQLGLGPRPVHAR